MRILKILLVTLTIGTFTFAWLGCSSESSEAEVAENQVATVQRGDLTIDITAAGNLALSRTEDLVIDLFYGQSGTSGVKGTVGEVLVEEGDSVEEGQVLAKLDTTEWDEQLRTLEKALLTDQRNLSSKERALTKTERQVTAFERQVAAKELAVRQAQLDLQTVEDSLYETDEVKSAYDDVDTAEFEIRVAQVIGDWPMVDYWRERLEQAEEDLQDILNRSGVTVSGDAALQFEKAKLQFEQKKAALEDAQIAVEDANYDVEDAQVALENAKLDVEDAQQDVEDTQSDLDEAKSLSPIITAPFDGFVTNVNVEGGDEVLKGTVAMQIADPEKFEAEIMVSEMDIRQVKVGGEAWVQVDAMPGLSLPAEVTHISPTATIQSGVVNYRVKVEVKSLETIQQEQQAARQEAMEKMQQGELPERLQQAIEEGRLTQEQAEEMMGQMQRGQGGQQPQVHTAVPEDFQLREGLTVTVSIIVAERGNVLLVPNSAITTEGRQTFVQVLAADGTLEQRAIQTGISDYQFTEVTEGLGEGEQIIVPEGTTTTTPTMQQGQRRPGGMFIPGMGRPH